MASLFMPLYRLRCDWDILAQKLWVVYFWKGLTSDSFETTYTYVFWYADYEYHSENWCKFEFNDKKHENPIKSWFFPFIFVNNGNFEKYVK